MNMFTDILNADRSQNTVPMQPIPNEVKEILSKSEKLLGAIKDTCVTQEINGDLYIKLSVEKLNEYLKKKYSAMVEYTEMNKEVIGNSLRKLEFMEYICYN